MSRPEYVWCVESANGNFTCKDPDNPTNDIDIPTRMPRLRTPVAQIYLGSVEFPMSQLLVENVWNTLYYDTGLRLIANMQSELCVREFTVIVNNTPITAIVPLLFNPVVDVDLTDPTAPIFTTLFDHALDLRGQWNWGQPIQLISTPLTDPALIELTANNPNLTIISNTQFQISNAPAVAYPNPGGIFGYVHAPPIASPQYLAQIVQAALDLVAPGEFSVTYSIDTGRFTFKFILTNNSTCVTNPPIQTGDVVHIYIPSNNCLAFLMGFGCGTVPVPTPPTPLDDCKKEVFCKTYQLEGGFGYQCFSQINLTPANYGPDSFAAQLYLQWNRFYFDGGCNNDPANRPIFVFSTSDGTCVQFPIEYGQYTPDTFAEFLQTQMNLADPLMNTYTVTWNSNTGKFCFEINGGVGSATFGLEFNNVNSTFNPGILGFDAISYRGKKLYCSKNDFTVPTSNCCGELLRYSSVVFTPTVMTTQGKFCITINPPRCVPNAQLTDLGGGLVQITTLAPLVAHGLQPEDVVNVRVTGTGMIFSLRVVEVVDAFTVRAEVGSVSALIGAAGLPVSMCMGDMVVASLLWADQQRPNELTPQFLGFVYQDVLFSPGMTSFISPFNFCLDPPNHVLLVITDPNGSTHTNHAWQQSNIPNIFGKIILYPSLRLERNFPMIMYIPSVYQVEKMHFLWLNPNHRPYRFHGKNWSMTLNLVVAEAQIEMTCF